MPFSGIWHSILDEADQLTGPELHFHSIAQPHLVYFYQNRDSVNNVTGDHNDDRSITVHFDGYPDQPNFFYTRELDLPDLVPPTPQGGRQRPLPAPQAPADKIGVWTRAAFSSSRYSSPYVFARS